MSADVALTLSAKESIQVGSVVALSWKNVVMRKILNTVPLYARSEPKKKHQGRKRPTNFPTRTRLLKSTFALMIHTTVESVSITSFLFRCDPVAFRLPEVRSTNAELYRKWVDHIWPRTHCEIDMDARMDADPHS